MTFDFDGALALLVAIVRQWAIEARRNPGAMYVCWCAHRNDRENTPEHDPDCPAATPGDNDTVIVITYEDARAHG